MDSLLKTYAKEHPTLLLSICYFLVTLTGVIYSHFFYREFGIAILKFADLSDFLLASILEPISVLIFVGWFVVYYVLYKGELRMRKRYQNYGKFVDKTLKPKYSDPLLFMLAIIVFTVIFLKDFAVGNAEKIKSGETDSYVVLIPSVNGDDVERQVALIGGSSRFSYFYDAATNEAKVVPVESISYMRKILTKKPKVELNQGEDVSEKDDISTSANG